MIKCKQFLDYAATYPDTIITYRSSDMVLSVHSDESYLTEPHNEAEPVTSYVKGYAALSVDVLHLVVID